MAVKHDAILVDHGSYYDIQIDEMGDIATEDSLDSTILTSLFTEARASEDQVTDPSRRRGWIGNQDGEFILGSTLWVYGQLRNRQVEFNELGGVAKESLLHMISDGRATKITASMTTSEDGPRLSIRIERPNNKVDFRHYFLWEQTGA